MRTQARCKLNVKPDAYDLQLNDCCPSCHSNTTIGRTLMESGSTPCRYVALAYTGPGTGASAAPVDGGAGMAAYVQLLLVQQWLREAMLC